MDLRTLLTFALIVSTLMVTTAASGGIGDVIVQSNATVANNFTDVIGESNVTAENPSQSGDEVSCTPVDGSGSTKNWCDVNCNHTPRNCPASHCICAGVNENDEIADVIDESNVTVADNVTYVYIDPIVTADSPCKIQRKGCISVDGSGATQHWCDLNCPGNCPASHCSCPNDADYDRVVVGKLITCVEAQNKMITNLQNKSLNHEMEVKEIKDERNATDAQVNHQIQTHQSLIDSLQSVNTDQKQQIITLQGTASSLQNSLSSLQTENAAQKSQTTSLQGTVSLLQSSLSTLQSELNSMQTTLNFVTDTGLEVRLLGGNGKYYGAVEVTYNGRTGMLCDDEFDRNNNGAKVVCKMLGYRSGTYVDGNEYANVGTSNFVLDDVVCTGGESSLASCSHRAYGDENCNKHEIAGVRCSK